MAKQLNKKLVATLTIAAMLVMAIAAGLLIKTFGGGDPTYFESKAREAAASGDHVRAASLYGKAWRQSKSRQGKYLVWAGEEYLQAGDIPNALRAWEQAILSDPNCVEAHEKKLDHALESYRETDSQKAWQLIDELAGRLLEVTDVAASRPSTDDPARPRITAEEADRLRAKGHYARGLALIALQSQRAQNKEDGIGHLKKACELAPKNADYADALASQYARDAGQAMRRGVEEARQERFRPAVEEFFPKAAQHYRQAAAVYEALLKAAPDNAASHRYYGRFLYSQDRLSSAQIGPLTLPDEVREVFRSPRFALKMKAPGVFEATVKSDDMERVVAPAVGSGRTFRWVDLASRFYGLAARDPAEQATVAVSYEGTPEEAKKRLKALGMRIVVPKPPEGADAEEDWVDPDAGLIVGTIAASKLSDLVLLKEAASVHVRAIERPASK